MTETSRVLKFDLDKERIEHLYDAIVEFWLKRRWSLGRGSRPFSIELTKGSMLGMLWGGWRSMSIKLSIEEDGITARVNLFIPFTNITDWMEKKFDEELGEMQEYIARALAGD
ncbi:MAG: hypothetical protein GXO66_10445 [Euryarchaeota archaeon]|nr:hypothetical protein [Euryarchaeota archaeon]